MNSTLRVFLVCFAFATGFAFFSANAFSEDRYSGRMLFFAIQSFWKAAPEKPGVYELVEAHFAQDDLGRFQTVVKEWEASVKAQCLESRISYCLKTSKVHLKEARGGFSSHSQKGVYVAYVFKDEGDFGKKIPEWEDDLIGRLKKVSDFVHLDRRENESALRGERQDESEVVERLLKWVTQGYE